MTAEWNAVIARCMAVALVVAVLGACSDEGVPSPATTKLADGSTVWKIQEARCPEEGDCALGVYINRWLYDVPCDGRAVEPLDEGAVGSTFAVNNDLYVPEARTIEGKGPETLALHVRGGQCEGDEWVDRWVTSEGHFDDSGLDDPPEDPRQSPADP